MSEEALLTHAISKVRGSVLIIIGILVVYHSIFHLGYTTDSCKWLLSHGRFVANQNWQPYGCLMYTYNKTDARSCLRQTGALYENVNYIVIAGDTRMLQLYKYITDHLFTKSSSYSAHRSSEQLLSLQQSLINDTTLHRDHLYIDDKLLIRFEFLWRPLVSDDLFRNINNWILASRNQRYQEGKLEKNPRLLVLGSALWNYYNNNHLQNDNNRRMTIDGDNLAYLNTLAKYKRNLTRLTPMIDELASRSTKILWALQDPISEELIDANITNAQIDEFNYATKSILKTLKSNKNIHLWSSSRAIASGLIDSIEKDGIHSNELVLDYKAQIIMNLVCNPINNFEGTCCSDNPQVNIVQVFILSLALISVLLACFMIAQHRYSKHTRFARTSMRWHKLSQQDSICLMDDNEIAGSNLLDEQQEDANMLITNQSFTSDYPSITPPHYQAEIRYLRSSGLDNDLVMQLAQLGAIVIYFFICDQTNFFMKENKYFTLANFLLPITYVFALGLFFTEQQQTGAHQGSDTQAPMPTPSSSSFILDRNQTNEWKGWMQLVILIYNMSGANKNVRIYMLIRVLLSSYLFLTGYGHFTYFWETKDLSIKRLWRVS